MQDAVIVGSSSVGDALIRRPASESGRLGEVEIIVPWQMPDDPGPTASPTVSGRSEPPCEMVVEWQLSGPVFSSTAATQTATQIGARTVA